MASSPAFDADRPAGELDRLEGLIVQFGSKYRGMGKLLSCFAESWDWLKGRAGVMPVAQAKDPDEIGYYIPCNLFEAGERPATLEQCEPDPHLTTPSGLPLMLHQRRAVALARTVTPERAGILIGAPIGSGKSISALQALWLDGFLQRGGVVIGPLAALDTWCGPKSDALVHYGLTITPCSGTTVFPGTLQRNRWYFVHYDILGYWHSTIFRELGPRALIADETQDLCNPKSDRAKAARNLSMCSTLERRILLSGSPMPKDRLDLYGQLSIAQPLQWGQSYVPFGISFCGGHQEAHAEDASHWVFDGRTGTKELQARLAGVYLRYGKEQLKDELPKLERHRVEIELDEEDKAKYHLALTDIRKYVEQTREGGPLPDKVSFGGMVFDIPKSKPPAAELMITSALKSILDRGKIKHARRVIEDVMQKHHHLVIGTWRQASAKKLYKELTNRYAGVDAEVFGPATGTMAWEKRLELADAFAAAPRAIFVASRGAVKYSINRLAAGDACLQITPDWNPDSNLQFEGRLWRKGNPNPIVHSYFMIAPGTLDDRILELLAQKGDEARGVSPVDTDGHELAVDLDPTGFSGENWSVEEILSFLPEVETY